jgi:aminoglycoside 2'-N-acetyltransferase I
VVERELHISDLPLRTGYVEAAATDPAEQGRGWGTRVLEDVTGHIRAAFELGALGTGAHRFYERLGWQRWRGPSFVRTESGPIPTPEDDGHILVLTTPMTPPLDFTAAISCDWRAGDVW